MFWLLVVCCSFRRRFTDVIKPSISTVDPPSDLMGLVISEIVTPPAVTGVVERVSRAKQVVAATFRSIRIFFSRHGNAVAYDRPRSMKRA